MRRLFVVGALVASVSLALMASSAASAPLVDRFHGTFSDNIERIQVDPHIPHTDSVRGFVFDVATGKLNEVV